MPLASSSSRLKVVDDSKTSKPSKTGKTSIFTCCVPCARSSPGAVLYLEWNPTNGTGVLLLTTTGPCLALCERNRVYFGLIAPSCWHAAPQVWDYPSNQSLKRPTRTWS